MEPNPEQYRLGEDEHQAIFESKIKPFLFAETISSRRPVAVVFGGQPGAGKSASVAAATEELKLRGGAVQIEGDALRDYHPAYARLMIKDDRTAAFYTDRDAGRWVEKAIAHAKEQRVNLVIEGTMRNPDVVASTMKNLREAGYEIDARALAVPWRLSEQGILQRYENQKVDRGYGRMTAPKAHKAAYDGMLQTLERIEREKWADRVTIYRRGNEAIYSNTLDRGQWVHEPHARSAVETERNRSMTLTERRDYASGFDRLANLLSRPDRQASAEEISGMETLRRQAHALYAIEKNRDSLALMERSYSKQDRLKQSQFQVARIMLNEMDGAVSTRLSDVHLPGTPIKTNDMSDKSASSQIVHGALEMLKPSIHAIERLGMTVHHELRQQWQSSMRHQVEHDYEKSFRSI